MKIGTLYRYAKPFDPTESHIDGVQNFFHETRCAGAARTLLEKGINPVATVIGPGKRPRRAAILISSSPHKVGSEATPWHDVFQPDHGHIRYFGDGKTPGVDPTGTPGNKVLLEAFDLQSSPAPEQRKAAPPLVFFRRASVAKKVKGFVGFMGFGVITRAQRVTQFDAKHERAFSNYVYDCAVFDMSAEHEEFHWNWINARRDPTADLDATHKASPRSWREWVADGVLALPRITRRVSKLLVTKTKDQLPASGSKEERALKEIYSFYDRRKARFEALAYAVTKHVLLSEGRNLVDGWITPASGDGGGDFVCRLDLGQGFSTVKQIVYGQAKCTSPQTAVNGLDIARTVARLKRGWFGVFVTTSYFSEPVQREIIEDEYPILLINGASLVREVLIMLGESSAADLQGFLQYIDSQYDDYVVKRRPEEILLH